MVYAWLADNEPASKVENLVLKIGEHEHSQLAWSSILKEYNHAISN